MTKEKNVKTGEKENTSFKREKKKLSPKEQKRIKDERIKNILKKKCLKALELV